MYLANPLHYETESFLDIGYIDSKLYEGDKINYCTVISSVYWGVELNSMQLTNPSYNLTMADFSPDRTLHSKIAVIDSGTSIIALPPNDFSAFLNALNSQNL